MTHVFERLSLQCPYVRAREYLPQILESGSVLRVDFSERTVFARFKRGRHPLHANDPWHAYWSTDAGRYPEFRGELMVRPIERGAVLELYGDYWPPSEIEGETPDLLAGARMSAVIARTLLERLGAEIDSQPNA